MRLIDADAMKLDLESEKKDTYENGMYSVSNGLGIALTCVEDQPTIDAVPVVHGKWENVHTISAGLFLRNREDFTESQCSVCGRWTVRLARFKNDCFCPLCGADMRGEQNANG